MICRFVWFFSLLLLQNTLYDINWTSHSFQLDLLLRIPYTIGCFSYYLLAWNCFKFVFMGCLLMFVNVRAEEHPLVCSYFMYPLKAGGAYPEPLSTDSCHNIAAHTRVSTRNDDGCSAHTAPHLEKTSGLSLYVQGTGLLGGSRRVFCLSCFVATDFRWKF